MHVVISFDDSALDGFSAEEAGELVREMIAGQTLCSRLRELPVNVDAKGEAIDRP